jgi:hypothetical protein
LTWVSTLGVNKYHALSGNDIFTFEYGYLCANDVVCGCAINMCDKTVSDIFEPLKGIDVPVQSKLIWSIPGMSSGCLSVLSLLLLTLECFYNQTCVNKLISYFQINQTFNAMTFNNHSCYQSNSTVQVMIDHLMIEDWEMNISCSKYYSECASSLCTYMKISRRGFVYGLKNWMISLLSSLTSILGLTIPFLIRFILQLKERTPKPRISCK